VKKSVVGPNTTLSSPIFDGASVVDGVYDDEMKLKQQAETFFSILTYEEQEIIRLKFFEELTDGEVMYVMGVVEGTIGAKIYQVLKKGYEVLFGQVSSAAGVYFGELHSFLARLKSVEKIPVPETFKLKLRSEIENKLQKLYSDIYSGSSSGGFEKGASTVGHSVGSSDPAKAFVYAAKGMSKEQIDKVTEEYVKEREVARGVASKDSALDERFSDDSVQPFERKLSIDEVMMDKSSAGVEEEVPVNYVEYERTVFIEKVLDVWERWKYVMTLVPTTMFIAAVTVVISTVWFVRVEDEGVTGLPFKIDYVVGFEPTNTENFKEDADYGEKVLIEESLIARIAEIGDVDRVDVSREDKNLGVSVGFVDGSFFKYVFDKQEGGEYTVLEFNKF